MAIRRVLIFVFFLSGSVSAYAQDVLVRLSGCMLNESTFEQRRACGIAFEHSLDSLLNDANGWNYPLDTIRFISALTAPDNAFKLITWNVPHDDGTFGFYGRIRFANKSSEPIKIIRLNDARNSISKPQTKSLNAENWFGALYYKIIRTKHKRKTYYTLLGWNGNTALSNQKIIDVLQVSKDGRVTFGAPLFEDTKAGKYRVVLEYAEQAAVSLRYLENDAVIVFDHLVPTNPLFEGQFAFYSSDFSNDAYRFEKGKWKFIRNYAAKNERDFRPEDFKKPEKGIKR
jgi:hypothetical protein